MRTNKKRIYISGPISGHDLEERKEAFAQAAEALSLAGWMPVNPFEKGVPDDAPRELHMKKDIELLLKCDGILLLRGWKESNGARAEYVVAKSIGLRILKQKEE